ncbi:MAG TPA: serine/threonine-protein kinase [Kofleriaceae bacterium]
MSIAAGATIGNYRVIAKIGTGGMGAVYVAEHPLIGKKVALKVIHRELATNKEVVQRFFQEARAVNKIGNEHIVEIHDFGVTPEGDHFYIMEYLEGRTLASVLTTDKVMDVMRALHVGGQIANALTAAHNAGVIHRDLKPDNIMLLPRGNNPDYVKVLDFGLAKMFQGHSAVQTAAGVLLGTPQYMSPEACESKRDVDHRTDIYALGILLFQMMTGRLPFDGDSMGEVLIKQVTALPPAPRGINPAIPPSVEQVLLRCLAKQPDARFPNMNALRDALLDPDRYLHSSPSIAPARSVGPGEAPVDARHVIAAAEAAMAARRGNSGHAPIAPPQPVRQMPLPAQQQTMIEGAHLAPIQMPPTAQTLQPLNQQPIPGLPQQFKNNTMRIATPLGYSKRPPRRVWPIVLVVGLALGLGGGAFAVIFSGGLGGGSGGGSGSAAPSASHDAAVVAVVRADAAITPITVDAAIAASAPVDAVAIDAAPVDAAPIDAVIASATIDAGAPVPVDAVAPAATQVTIEFQTKPSGATLYGPDGKVLGQTPTSIEWTRGKDAVAFTFKAKGYQTKKKQIVVDSDQTVECELLKAAATAPKNGKEPSTKPPELNGSGLERPE